MTGDVMEISREDHPELGKPRSDDGVSVVSSFALEDTNQKHIDFILLLNIGLAVDEMCVRKKKISKGRCGRTSEKKRKR